MHRNAIICAISHRKEQSIKEHYAKENCKRTFERQSIKQYRLQPLSSSYYQLIFKKYLVLFILIFVLAVSGNQASLLCLDLKIIHLTCITGHFLGFTKEIFSHSLYS